MNMREQAVSNEQKLSVPMIFFLGLAPGLVMLLLIFILSSPIFGINFPIFISVFLSFVIGHIPIDLGILKFFAWKENKKIKDLILFRNKTPLKKMIPAIIIPLILAIIAFGFIKPIELKFWESFVSLPDLFRIEDTNFREMKYLKLTVIMFFIFDTSLGPIVEEIYFRGFLLPRMGVFGKFAPLVNSVIFSVYHFFSPRQNITRIVGVTPMAYSVWKNKDIKIGAITHCSLNFIGDLGLVMVVF